MFTQESISSDIVQLCSHLGVCVLRKCVSVCTVFYAEARKEMSTLPVCLLFSLERACVRLREFVGLSRLMVVDTCGSLIS